MLSILGGLGGITDVLKELIQLFPNAEQRAAAASKIQDVELAIATNQSATNTAEAQTGNLFLAGWRPFIGWVCGFGFLYAVVQPILHLPAIDTTVLQNVLWGLLGLGTMRTVEKVGGVATTVIKKIIGK